MHAINIRVSTTHYQINEGLSKRSHQHISKHTIQTIAQGHLQTLPPLELLEIIIIFVFGEKMNVLPHAHRVPLYKT